MQQLAAVPETSLTKSDIHLLYRGERLPRRAPDQVQEQRHTLGTFERAQIAQALQLAQRQQTIDAVEKAAIPIAVAALAFGGVMVISNTWQKVTGLVPSFDGMLDGVSNTILGSVETKEAILREANEQAAKDGQPLPLWRKAMHRFGMYGFVNMY